MKKNYFKKIVSVALICITINVNAQSVAIYTENFTAPVGFTSTGEWLTDIGTIPSSSAYPGASGGDYMIAANSNNNAETLTLDNSISTLAYSNVTVQWGGYIDPTFPTPVTFSWSPDGTTWNAASFTNVTNNTFSQQTNVIALPAGAAGLTNLRLRWQYAGNSGNIFYAIDDIVISGAIAKYFNKATGNLNVLGTWGTNTDGTGTSPSNFTSNDITYNITNNAAPTIGGAWTVSGTNSKVITGNGTFATNFTIPAGVALLTGTIDVTNSATLTIANTTIPALGILGSNSTINYAAAGAQTTYSVVTTYGNLTFSGGGAKTYSVSTTITGVLNISTGTLNMAAGGLRILTLNGTITGAGSITGNNALPSRITIGGTTGGAFGTLVFTAGSQTIHTLLINRTGAGSSVTLGSNLVVASNYNHQNGTLNLNGFFLTINSTLGTTLPASGNGNFTGSTTSSLTINGSGVITNSLLMDQTSGIRRSLSALILNRAQTITIGNALNIINSITPTLGTINLGSGIVTLKSTAGSKARVGVVGGGFAGTLNVETYIPGGSAGWNTLGPAGVSGLTVSNWDGGSGSSSGFAMTCSGCINGPTSAGGSNFVSIQGDPAGNGVYTELISSSALTPGKGYWVYIGSSLTTAIDIIQTTTGAVVTGPVTSGNGFISNPYPSPMSFTSLQSSNPGLTSLDVYDPNSATYKSYNGGIPSDVIPMGQGFYANGITSVSFQESNKTASNNSMLKTSSTNSTSIGTVFQLKIEGWYGDYDNTYVRFHNNATPVFDDLLDAYKRYATPGYLGYPGSYQQYTSIATVNTNQDYAINSLPYAVTSDAVIPVVAKASATGQYTISPVDIQNLPPAACVILKDKLLNINHDLRTGSYIFNMSDTTSAPRFELNICADQTVTSIKQLTANNNNVLIGQDGASGVFVKTTFDKSTKSVISAYNVMGQKIITDKEVEGSENLVYLDFKDLHNQIIIIKVINDKGQTTKKVYLN